MSQKYLKLWIAAAVLAGVLCAVGIYLYQRLYVSDCFFPGVKIASVNVRGLTRENAALLVKDRFARLEQTNIRFYTNTYSTDAKMSEICSDPNVDKLVDQVFKQERRRNVITKLMHAAGISPASYNPEIEYRPQALRSLADSWDRDLGSECRDAKLVVDANDGLIVVPEQRGRGVDLKGVLNELPKHWNDLSDDVAIPIVVDEEEPAVKAADLQGMGELSSYTTHFRTSEINRSSNLRRATASINGHMIPANSEFSFNDTVGERTVNSGYSDAMVIVGNRFEPGLGGGVCQVSSTLYNSVLLAGLEIIERHNHNLAVVYVPQGLDATVSYGLQDFRFKNTSSAPIYIRALTDGGQLNITVYGNLKDKKNIKLSHIVDQVIPFGETRETDPTLAPGEEQVDHGGAVGYSVRAFRSYYDNNDKLIKREQLSSDYYAPLNRLIRVGPPADATAPTQEPSTGNPAAPSVPPGQESGNSGPDQEGGQSGETNSTPQEPLINEGNM